MRFTSTLAALSLGITAFAYEIPAACNCSGPGCQYGIPGQGLTYLGRSFLAKDGSDNGCRADVGSTFKYKWASAPCLPYSVYALAIRETAMHDYPTGTILQSKELVGPRVVGLAGHNGTFEESLTLSGEGLVKGTRYTIGLALYNATTGAVKSGPSQYEFVWQDACIP